MKVVATLVSLASVAVSFTNAASLQEVTNFGPNPTNTQMFIYVPDVLPANAPIVVGIHWCTGTAQAYYSGSQWATLASQYGFIVIYPDAPDPGGCWDVHSDATLLHDAGGDSLGIASMVRYTLQHYSTDPSRVFVTGTSSGGMMTNVLAGAYPDLFAAGASFAGVPFGCFAGPDFWNSQCSTGQIIKTGQQWGDQVRAGYPGYTGRRPRLQIWHGTEDDVLRYQNHLEGIKEWTNVFGYSSTPTSVQTNSPSAGWTRNIYGPNFQAITLQGGPHNIPNQERDVLVWFGLDQTSTVSSTRTSTTSTSSTSTRPSSTSTSIRTSSSSTSTRTSSSSTRISTSSSSTRTSSSSSYTRSSSSSQGAGTVPRWGQCGGIGYTGSTQCVSPWVCTYSNDWYSQCL